MLRSHTGPYLVSTPYVGVLDTEWSSFPPEREDGICRFWPVSSVGLAGGRGCGECLHANPNYFLLLSVAPNVESFPLSAQIQTRHKPVPPAAPRKIRTYNPCLSFPLQGGAWSLSFPPDHIYMDGVFLAGGGGLGLRQENVLVFFLWASLSLISC